MSWHKGEPKSLVKTVTVTKSYTVSGSGGVDIDFTYSTPDGYTLVGFTSLKLASSTMAIGMVDLTYTPTTARVYILNRSSSAQTHTASLTLVFVRTG